MIEELLTKYSFSEIILFIIILGFTIKELITFYDWAHGRIKQKMNKENEHEDIKQQLTELSEHLDNIEIHLTTMIKENREHQYEMQESIDLLIASDKDDIKAWITQQHHHFCYELGYIDDYSLDCIEKRYSHYRDEGGNSYVSDLINEIRALPKIPTTSENKEITIS